MKVERPESPLAGGNVDRVTLQLTFKWDFEVRIRFRL